MTSTTDSGTTGSAQLSPTEIRLRLLENGYSPLPNVGKACYAERWPTLALTAEEITSWAARKRPDGESFKRFKDTGLRVENGLGVLDFDIDHEIMEEIAHAVEKAHPALQGALVRFGKGRKEAWFVRLDEPFGRIATRRWLAPGADIDADGSHVVEAFGGAAARQFGAFGAHTREPDGSVKIAYEWAGEQSPLTVPLDRLPELTKAEVFAVIDLVEELLAAAGWTPVAKTKKGETEALKVWDLVEGMLFETNHGEVDVTLEDLRARARAGEEGLRVSASFIEPGKGHSLTRCLVGTTHDGDISIWDGATDTTHFAADRAPAQQTEVGLTADRIAEGMAKLMKLQKEAEKRRSMVLDPADDYDTALGKALNGYAFCAYQQLQVVPVWADSVGDGMTKDAFRSKLDPNSMYVSEDGAKKPKKHNPYDAWHGSKKRIDVRGLRMRPDMPRPVYEEDGERWVNIYSPVAHPATGGTADMGQRLFEQVVPDPIERLWFTRWIAYKYRHPEVPGPAVLLVARDHGTGRGTVAALLKMLFGSRYVKPLDFKTFTGKTYQAQYNTWMAESLLVTVNESAEADGGSIYASKRDTYERLKELIEPRAERRHFVRHGLPPFTAYSFCTFLIATNHIDALPIPAGDRRIWVGTCGEPREQTFWDAVNEWMGDPENIGAFARWLEDLGMGDYSPYAAPPMTAGKRLMTELSQSPVDALLSAAIDALPGEVLLPDQIIAAMKALQGELGIDLPDHMRWEPIARKQMQSRLHRIGVKDGPGWTVRVENRKHPTYARTPALARKWASGVYDVRHEALKNGEPSSTNSVQTALSKLVLVSSGEAAGG
jgi:hypothetical protein